MKLSESTDLLNMANALSVTCLNGLMSREEAKSVWRKLLRDNNLIFVPQRIKKNLKKKEGGEK